MADSTKPNSDAGISPAGQRLHQYAQLAAIAVIVVGCYFILHPFLSAVLFAAVVCSATWPLYLRLRQLLWGRRGLAALVMTLLLIVLVIGPTVVLAVNLADDASALVETVKAMLKGGPIQPPAWLRDIPLAGDLLADYWLRLASSRESLSTQWSGLLEPARNFLVGAGKVAGEGLLQLRGGLFRGSGGRRAGRATASPAAAGSKDRPSRKHEEHVPSPGRNALRGFHSWWERRTDEISAASDQWPSAVLGLHQRRPPLDLGIRSSAK